MRPCDLVVNPPVPLINWQFLQDALLDYRFSAILLLVELDPILEQVDQFGFEVLFNLLSRLTCSDFRVARFNVEDQLLPLVRDEDRAAVDFQSVQLVDAVKVVLHKVKHVLLASLDRVKMRDVAATLQAQFLFRANVMVEVGV